jgi:hypothetical protein
MMSQTAKKPATRLHAMRDHRVNLKAEQEIRHLHQKVDARSAIRLFGRPFRLFRRTIPPFLTDTLSNPLGNAASSSQRGLAHNLLYS